VAFGLRAQDRRGDTCQAARDCCRPKSDSRSGLPAHLVPGKDTNTEKADCIEEHEMPYQVVMGPKIKDNPKEAPESDDDFHKMKRILFQGIGLAYFFATLWRAYEAASSANNPLRARLLNY
jgi:hypothetical protein